MSSKQKKVKQLVRESRPQDGGTVVDIPWWSALGGTMGKGSDRKKRIMELMDLDRESRIRNHKKEWKKKQEEKGLRAIV